MVVLITVVVLTILISSQCSLYEAVLYSTRVGALEAEKTQGKRRKLAKKLLNMKRKISVPLSAILILNTIANTAGATIAGMYANRVLGAALVPLFSILFTLGILFFAEIIPKNLGAVHWRIFWPMIVWPLTVMRYLLFPIIFVTHKFSDLLTKRSSIPPITEEDILGMIRLGAKDGEITQWESLMLHNVINLDTREVVEIMTPRTVMFTLEEKTTVEDALEAAKERGFSRIPIYRDEPEDIVGYVTMHDLTSAIILNKHEAKLSSLCKPITFVPEDQNCLILITEFLKKRRHISVIEDKYGGVAGLVTLEDLIETVLGAEIVDETDSVVDLQKYARRRRWKRAENNHHPPSGSEDSRFEEYLGDDYPEETWDLSEDDKKQEEEEQEQEEEKQETVGDSGTEDADENSEKKPGPEKPGEDPDVPRGENTD